jgi:hypothetical protein
MILALKALESSQAMETFLLLQCSMSTLMLVNIFTTMGAYMHHLFSELLKKNCIFANFCPLKKSEDMKN